MKAIFNQGEMYAGIRFQRKKKYSSREGAKKSCEVGGNSDT